VQNAAIIAALREVIIMVSYFLSERM